VISGEGSMNARRTIVWAISILVGIISTIVTIAAFATTLEKFTVGNAILVFASTGSIIFIWLDYIFRTQYLRN
jgi:hypothetical protein